ncbi:hypothetical protein [Streptomyces sp. S.PB5]|uniref:hypothetical protein n=1 Tax=Streptomyces sp. S.PB5 TaxID=3020844 RepID=UPI0025B1D1DB|nr:hypothetical protein [Streptomyces sp. S.PB5]MDN3026377.1 hypothetical protein [Streptomyces sp. S.PB5]
MSTRLLVSIRKTADALPASAPETAVVRLVSILPGDWVVRPAGNTSSTATLAVTAPDGTPAPQALRTVDDALSTPPMHGWIRG